MPHPSIPYRQELQHAINSVRFPADDLPMIPVPLRRACVLFLAICCLGLNARLSPPDIAPLDEPRLTRAEQHEVSAVLQEIIAHVKALSRHTPAEGGTGSGNAAVHPVESILLPVEFSQWARLPTSSDRHLSGVTSSHQARAPPLPS
ncbi:hypothetical protein [Chelativorans salis]|uniref:Uncharacterized protein n=1 Tax=Chelativorans salis TaxID=2978478 RepID=A0ABT2LK01_9HYPH|nr:hypothetical protein [Chelativorans sp. EGI FJ00035]MCT7374679.1 hypothetical protein [Chelativorans sp. EGI FJ00035]